MTKETDVSQRIHDDLLVSMRRFLDTYPTIGQVTTSDDVLDFANEIFTMLQKVATTADAKMAALMARSDIKRQPFVWDHIREIWVDFVEPDFEMLADSLKEIERENRLPRRDYE